MNRSSPDSADTGPPVSPLGRSVGSSLAEQLYAAVRRDISTGRLAPGQRLPTESRYASALDLGVGTVRRAFDRLTADGLVTRQQGRGCFVVDDPTAIDRRVVIAAPRAVFEGRTSPFYADLCRLIRDGAAETGFTAEVVSWGAGTADRAAAPDLAGAILIPAADDRGDVADAMAGLPRVVLTSVDRADAVQLDHRESRRLALEAIAQRNCRSLVAVMVGRASDRALRRWAARDGISVSVRHLPANETMATVEADAYSLVRRILEEGDPPDAVFFGDDVIARGGTRALLGGGVDPATTHAVVCCGLQQIVPLGYPVTYIVHDTAQLAAAAVGLLKRQIAGHDADGPKRIGYRRLEPAEMPAVAGG